MLFINNHLYRRGQDIKNTIMVPITTHTQEAYQVKKPFLRWEWGDEMVVVENINRGRRIGRLG
jgi:hypothetical protein